MLKKNYSVKLNSKNFDFLIREFNENKEIMNIFKPLENSIGIKKVLLNHRQYEEILDFLSNTLMKKGVNNNDEPNDFGLKVEEIIDVFISAKYPVGCKKSVNAKKGN